MVGRNNFTFVLKYPLLPGKLVFGKGYTKSGAKNAPVE
jgi:hypothetical protein